MEINRGVIKIQEYSSVNCTMSSDQGRKVYHSVWDFKKIASFKHAELISHYKLPSFLSVCVKRSHLNFAPNFDVNCHYTELAISLLAFT